MFADRTNWNLAPNPLSEALARQLADGKRLLDLSASNPTECGLHYDGAAILDALGNSASLAYVPDPKGLLKARQSVTEYYADRGNEVRVEDIVLTTSTSEAYSFVFRTLCNPGEELLVPAPSYPLFGFLADISDVRLVSYPLLYDHGWQMDFHALEQAMTPRTRGVIIVNPNNPTGNFIKQEEMTRLNEICSARKMAVIADEVFLDFAHCETVGHRDLGQRDAAKSARTRGAGDKPPISYAANSGALTFTMSGLSKISGLPQMKASWLVTSGPEALKKDALGRLEVVADTYLSMNAPIQLAIPSFLQQRHGMQKQLMARIRRNLAELDRQLSVKRSCSRLAIEGGWYGVLRVPVTRSDDELAVELLRTKNIYVHPGHFYDFPTDGHLIVSLIMPEQGFGEGIRLLLSMF
jgi:alanine-synthesizing transaminase